MEIFEMNKCTLRKMKKIVLEAGNINTEGKLYYFEAKNRWQKEVKVYKELYNDMGHVFSNKLFTLNELIDNRDTIGIDEFVLPEKIVVVGNKVEGFIMPYIHNTSFYSILNNNNISNYDKINLFKEIADILKRMDIIRNNQISDFYLNDLHEGNFIYNLQTGKLNVVDLDSCKINGNKPFASKYLTPLSPISKMDAKYHQNHEDIYSGFIIPDRNSDLYCYIIMLLNFLYKDRITNLSREGYFMYLQYLVDIGLPYVFVDKLAKIYEYVDNENVGDYLYLLNDQIINKARKEVFLKKK